MKEGWEIKKLSEVCELFAGGDVPKEDFSKFKTEKHQVPIFANGEKNDGLYGYTSIAKITKPSITVSARGTIGFSVKRLESFYPIVRLITITPKDLRLLDLTFLDYSIKGIDFKHSGSSIPQLTIPMIRDYEFPLPPLPEQQRIVSILDEAFAAIDKAKANAEQNLKNAKELFESYLQGVFEKKGDGWAEKPLINLTTKIGSGATPRGGQKSYKTEGISLVRSMNVHDSEFRKKNLAFIDEQQAKALDNVTLQKNDVLLNITGASVARCCVIPKGYLPARVNQHVSIIRANKEIIDPIFLNLLLTSKYYKDQLLFTGEQGATRQAITKAQIEVFKIDFPSLEVQKTIVQQLDALRAKTQKMEAIYQKKIADLEELKKSVLQKAFAGELPSGEPAEPKTEKELV
jgi:type I restriction enzyme S subunit